MLEEVLVAGSNSNRCHATRTWSQTHDVQKALELPSESLWMTKEAIDDAERVITS
jgi:hypothetical protein